MGIFAESFFEQEQNSILAKSDYEIGDYHGNFPLKI